MLSILCVRLTIKVKVGIPESFKVGSYPPSPKKLGRVTLSSDDVPGAALFNNETNYKFKFNLNKQKQIDSKDTVPLIYNHQIKQNLERSQNVIKIVITIAIRVKVGTL